jgi:hypothetical protein
MMLALKDDELFLQFPVVIIFVLCFEKFDMKFIA